MRSVAEHLAAVLALSEPLVAGDVPVAAAFERVVRQDIVARVPVPPFDNSAMDGYAVRLADAVVGAELTVVGDVPAGVAPVGEVGVGQAMRIMTGAMIPPGADAVVPVELTDQQPGAGPLPARVRVEQEVGQRRHIRCRGEDVGIGETVLEAGAVATPAAAAAAVSVGVGRWRLSRPVRVAVVATGDELRPAGEELRPGQIPDSNSILLAGLVNQFGGEVAAIRRFSDDVAVFGTEMAALKNIDLLVTTGGVSAGAFEVVREAAGAGVEFTSVAMQPGKPQGAGLWHTDTGEVPALAFPGNPVSVFVSSWIFLRPLLRKMAGYPLERVSESPRRLPVRTGWQKKVGRAQYAPVVLTANGVELASRLGSGSHAIASLHRADGLAILSAKSRGVEPGEVVDVLPCHPSAQ